MEYRDCEVCNYKILVNKTKIGKSNSKSLSASYYYDSDYGIYFLRKWFCNSCWNEVNMNIIKV